MYISEHINFLINTDIELFDKTAESLWINIIDKNEVKMVISVLYRHPNNPIPQFSINFSEVLTKLSNKNYNCYIVGDFNINTYQRSEKLCKNYQLMIKR